MKLKQQFSEQDLARIKSAVKQAEDKISGEIVPVIVERSGFYNVAIYKCALIAAAISFIAMIISLTCNCNIRSECGLNFIDF